MKRWFDKNYTIVYPSAVGEKKDIGYPCFADTKYDGELNFVIIRNGVVEEMVNKDKYGGHRVEFTALEQIKQLGIKGNVMVVCELYMGKGDGAVYEFLRNRDNDDLKCALFAMWEYKEVSPRYFVPVEQKAFIDMRADLAQHFTAPLSHVHLSKGKTINNEQEMKVAVDTAINDGWEGVIAKALRSFWVGGDTKAWTKIKKKGTADLPVIGYSRKAKYLSLLLGHEVNGELVPLCRCANFKHSERLQLKARLEQAKLPPEKQFNKQNFLVDPSIMVEVEFQELIHINGVLTGLRHPSFVREREDKDIHDIKFDKKVAF